MGLPGYWLEVLALVGYEKFIGVWRILDRAVEARSDTDSMIEVKLRRYSSYRRYQRNRFIEGLVAMGYNDREIRSAVEAQLDEKLSVSQIHRLASRRRVRR